MENLKGKFKISLKFIASIEYLSANLNIIEVNQFYIPRIFQFWVISLSLYELYLANMYSLSKKKSRLSPADKNIQLKTTHSRNKSRTQNSPAAKRSLSKDQIKNTIKKIVCHENVAALKPSHIKQQPKPSRKIKSGMEISIPNIRSSLTPKGFNCSITKPDYRQRQVQSTKAADNSKMFTNSGRYDFKQLFQNKNYSQLKQSARQHTQSQSSHSQNKMIRQGSRIQDRKIQDATIKFNRDDDFDVSNILTTEQYEKFGDRFPEKFKRIALLGRGGFSVVWLGIHRSSKRKVAIKQILTKNPHETHLKQIWFGSYFFEKGGDPRQQFENHIGINNICKLYSYEIKTLDSWLYYEVCQESLGGSLFDIKSQNIHGEKSYKVQYKELIYRMRQNISELKFLIIEVAKALYLINSHNIVHSDLKTENILLKVRRKDESGPYIKSLKLIDFGSSFLFTNLKQFSMATPQYMPPQILNYILFQNKLEYDVLMLNKMEKYKHSWIIDVWSLGCIVLEIITGIPLWMSLPTRIQDTGIKATGLFAVKGRLFQKIIQKQIEVVNNLNYYIFEENNSGIIVDKKVSQVLARMLSLEPQQRISPFQILNQFGIQCSPQKIPFY